MPNGPLGTAQEEIEICRANVLPKIEAASTFFFHTKDIDNSLLLSIDMYIKKDFSLMKTRTKLHSLACASQSEISID